MSRHILTLNAGSSSLKFALFRLLEATAARRTGLHAGELQRVLGGQLEGIGTRPHLSAKGADGAPLGDRRWDPEAADAPRDAPSSLRVVLDWLRSATDERTLELAAIGHRVVHGGVHHAAPTLIDERILAELATLAPLAPLHQPHNLNGIRAAHTHFPGTPQVACFDTAFHRGHAFEEEAFAIPREYHDAGVRRYGFHGLSYEYIAQRLGELDPDAACGRAVVAHLGSGASLCAMRAGRSVSSSMGFTPLDGLPMGTRPGQIDPGVLLWLMSERGMDGAALSELLYHRSGLKGLSGISNDMRDLHASEAPQAREAIDYFVARLRREIGAMAAVLGGIDALVFTAGIGENDAVLRARTVETMDWLGLRLDPQANADHGKTFDGRISSETSRARIWVIPTDEEGMIARHAAALIAS